MYRWQIKTTDTRTGNTLYTTEMPRLEHVGLPALGYRYESCMFLADGDSDVKDRYQTQEEAEAGHQMLVATLMQDLPAISDETVDHGDQSC